MTLMMCPECQAKVSDKAFACPGCGYPVARQGRGKGNWPAILGGVAGTYISAQALVTIIVGSIAFLAFAAIMIAAILR